MTQVRVRCADCGTLHLIMADSEGIQKWLDGELIQNALPDLSIEDRELLMSQTCSNCFDDMFDLPE